ncbi:MAG: hypothetical protein JNJ54_27825 [Myxococcaceae bacterium]|nr:hypothetical protein [Myxococcaceae bacterium]
MTTSAPVRRGSAGAAGVSSRFMSPDALSKMQKKLEATEKKLATTKDRLKRHKDMMARALLSPPAYKRAVERQKELEKEVRALSTEVKELKRLLTVA